MSSEGGAAVSFGGEKCRGARLQAEFRLELARDACRGVPSVLHNYSVQNITAGQESYIQ